MRPGAAAKSAPPHPRQDCRSGGCKGQRSSFEQGIEVSSWVLTPVSPGAWPGCWRACTAPRAPPSWRALQSRPLLPHALARTPVPGPPVPDDQKLPAIVDQLASHDLADFGPRGGRRCLAVLICLPVSHHPHRWSIGAWGSLDWSELARCVQGEWEPRHRPSDRY